MSWGFEEGRTYHRRNDIHARFRGQQQGGIITPANFPLVIIITGEEGGAHGYADEMRPDGAFWYFGEGQRGDMEMRAGNRAIRDHSENGKDLLLFRKMRAGLRFEGTFVCEGHHATPAPDTDGAMREAIVFELRPLSALVEHVEREDASDRVEDVALSTLRDRALAAARATPRSGTISTTVFERAAAVRAYVLARSNGRCEDCGEPAPFITASGRPFLEAHHVRRLTDGGPDDPRFVIAVCPNCHRRAHHGADREEVWTRMLAFLKMREGMET